MVSDSHLFILTLYTEFRNMELAKRDRYRRPPFIARRSRLVLLENSNPKCQAAIFFAEKHFGHPAVLMQLRK